MVSALFEAPQFRWSTRELPPPSSYERVSLTPFNPYETRVNLLERRPDADDQEETMAREMGDDEVRSGGNGGGVLSRPVLLMSLFFHIYEQRAYPDAVLQFAECLPEEGRAQV